MSKKYKNSLSVIGFFIICCLGLLVAYNLRKVDTSDAYQVMRSENLSINYFGDSGISLKNGETELKFSISNNTDKNVFYTINAGDIKNFNESISLSLINDNNTFVIEHTDKDEKVLLDNNQLGAYETANFTIKVKNDSNDNFSFDVMINEVASSVDTFAKIILKNNEIKKTSTIIGTETSILDEGLISDIDENGSTYYYRGAVKNNFVSFAGMIWRIVRINGDGTVRLVLNKNIETVHKYTSNADNFSYENADVKKFLEDWYNLYLNEYDNLISDGKFCNDINIVENSEYFNPYTRIITDNIPTFSCLGDKINSSIGLLTIDEVIYAGANTKDNNTGYYLYIKDSGSFWTMSSARFKNSNYYPFVINENGKLVYDNSATLNRGVRPVINLKAEVTATGDGTEANPYVIKSNEN